jgi:hypothetical protein
MLYSQFQSGANFHDVAQRKSGKIDRRAIIPTTYRLALSLRGIYCEQLHGKKASNSSNQFA